MVGVAPKGADKHVGHKHRRTGTCQWIDCWQLQVWQTDMLNASLKKISLASMIPKYFHVRCGFCWRATSGTGHYTKQGRWNLATFLWKKVKLVVKNTWSGQPRGKARLATAREINTKDLPIWKRTKQVTENAQCLASKSLFTRDQKKPNHQKAHSSWLFVTNKNQKIKFGSVTAPTRSASSFPMVQIIYQCRQVVNLRTIPYLKHVHASRPFCIQEYPTTT